MVTGRERLPKRLSLAGSEPDGYSGVRNFVPYVVFAPLTTELYSRALCGLLGDSSLRQEEGPACATVEGRCPGLRIPARRRWPIPLAPRRGRSRHDAARGLAGFVQEPAPTLQTAWRVLECDLHRSGKIRFSRRSA